MPYDRLLSIYTTFHSNLTEAEIANELITSVQLLNIQLSRVLFPGLHVWSNLARVPQTFHVQFPVLANHANEILLLLMLKVSSKKF